MWTCDPTSAHSASGDAMIEIGGNACRQSNGCEPRLTAFCLKCHSRQNGRGRMIEGVEAVEVVVAGRRVKVC
jgi:hypothetical protein